MVVLGGGAVSDEKGTPVQGRQPTGVAFRPGPHADAAATPAYQRENTGVTHVQENAPP